MTGLTETEVEIVSLKNRIRRKQHFVHPKYLIITKHERKNSALVCFIFRFVFRGIQIFEKIAEKHQKFVSQKSNLTILQ